MLHTEKQIFGATKQNSVHMAIWKKAISAPLYQTMDKVQKPSTPNCYAHSPQLFRTDYHHLFRRYKFLSFPVLYKHLWCIMDGEVHRVRVR